ncbi:MAG: hypothetical protein A2Y07_01135 [Planctomycetes bacterium GWF2_50_10]|nr:MAG: hypothetical protein A2Y07_01135 [Planctomycetes bacterium GWF2_50_10]
MIKPAILAIILLILGSILVAQDNGYLTDGKEIMRVPAPWISAQDRAKSQLGQVPLSPQTGPDEKPHIAYAGPRISRSTQIGAKLSQPAADTITDLRMIQQLAIKEHAANTAAAIDVLIKNYQKMEGSK